MSRPAPAPAASPVHKSTFERLVDTAMRGPRFTQTRDYALELGVTEEALSCYADGAVSLYERDSIQQVLVICDWARQFVVNRVKSRRPRQTRSAA